DPFLHRDLRERCEIAYGSALYCAPTVGHGRHELLDIVEMPVEAALRDTQFLAQPLDLDRSYTFAREQIQGAVDPVVVGEPGGAPALPLLRLGFFRFGPARRGSGGGRFRGVGARRYLLRLFAAESHTPMVGESLGGLGGSGDPGRRG